MTLRPSGSPDTTSPDDSASINIAIQAFRDQVASLPSIEVVQRRITGGPCVHLSDGAYAELKQRIARQYGVSHTEVLVVGSAKLGFSIAPTKRWKPFGDESDIDMAIASPTLYLLLWKELASLLASDPTYSWDRHGHLSRYHLKGWIRPDMLPPSPALSRADEWFEFFRSLSHEGAFGPYKLSAGIYYDISFLEHYQSSAVATLHHDHGEAS